MEAALTEDENNKYIIAHLEEKVQSLEKDKEQLYKDISSLEHDQDSSLENRQQLDWNYEQLKEEVKLLKLCIANLLLRLKKYEGGVSEAQ
jgi:peptidoglycan hydrolase CwlO-like protein